MKNLFIWALLSTFIFAAEAHKTGEFQTKFNENSPYSDISKMLELQGFVRIDVAKYVAKTKKPLKEGRVYDIKEETYELYVPEAYTKKTPHGLFVFVNEDDSGEIPAHFKATMDKHRLIWVSPNKCGNKQFLSGRRIPLALDAAWNMKKLYTINEERIYISGKSGGGRVASMMAPGYPQIFTGAYYIGGANLWDRVYLAAGRKGKFWYGFGKTSDEIYDDFMENSRIVFCTGSGDPNRKQSKIFYKIYKKEGFQVKLQDIPKLRLKNPNAEWFEKGIKFLDAPLFKSAKSSYKKGIDALTVKKYASAMKHLLKANKFGIAKAAKPIAFIQDKVDKEKAVYDELLAAKKYYQLDIHLSKVIKKYGTAAAFTEKAEEDLYDNEETNNEILAWKEYYKYKKRLKEKSTFKGALRKLADILDDYPGTQAAKKVDKTLDKYRKKK
ncbi:MAG: hypothetical protein HRT89_06845 [Lentisphaeria bacterium]|nr:hypothetical protein [Lentisphaeria bacterium]NQZ67771.1 hypothetical protein [Lentisphaeria bacterium]